MRTISWEMRIAPRPSRRCKSLAKLVFPLPELPRRLISLGTVYISSRASC